CWIVVYSADAAAQTWLRPTRGSRTDGFPATDASSSASKPRGTGSPSRSPRGRRSSVDRPQAVWPRIGELHEKSFHLRDPPAVKKCWPLVNARCSRIVGRCPVGCAVNRVTHERPQPSASGLDDRGSRAARGAGTALHRGRVRTAPRYLERGGPV